MKKIAFLGFIMLLCIAQTFAQRVSESQATQVCQRFLLDKGQVAASEGVKLTEVYTQDNGDVALYRFQLPDVGFVVVSASTTTPPILAYGFEHDFEMIPPVRDLFHLYKGEIAYAEKMGWDAKPKAAANWKRYLAEEFNPRATKDGGTVGPLLTTTWDQGKYYNTYCPWDVQAGGYYDYRVPNGCVALACSQILNYHRHPDRGTGSTSYIPQGYPRQTVRFYEHTYHYDAMTNHPTSYANEIAKLAYHYGVAIQMNYNYDGSGANTTAAKEKLYTTFKYDPSVTTYYRGTYLDTTVTQFYAVLRNEIDHKRPMYYSGCTETFSSCHAYVLDGYDENDLFSLNYGWGGSSNGFYAIDNFVAGSMHFDYGAETLVNIRPLLSLEPSQCQGHQRNTASFGYVADGSQTVRPYNPNPDCSWMVAAQGASAYNFRFDRLDLNEGDYVTIYNGPTVESGVKVTLTGSEKPTQQYSVIADSVLITFVGNSNNTEHYGFLISYSSTLPPRTCEEVTNMPGVWNGTLTDGSQDGEKYLPQTNCTWNINHNFVSGFAFAFPKFNLGYGDFVDVYNNSTNPATLYKRFDIYNMPEGVYTVDFKRMKVHFVSDNWDQSEGFAMDYYALAAVEDYNGLEDLTVYPNPATDQVTIDFSLTESANVTVRLMDMAGKTLRQGVYGGDQGANRINFGLADVAKGIYLLEISNPAGKSVRKVTVQ
jgi:hypothetical protein